MAEETFWVLQRCRGKGWRTDVWTFALNEHDSVQRYGSSDWERDYAKRLVRCIKVRVVPVADQTEIPPSKATGQGG